MKKFLLSSLVVLFTFVQSLHAQKEYYFSEGLGVGPCHAYGREALYTDQLAYQLYAGTLAKPAAGQVLLTDEAGQAVSWQAVQADTAHRFRSNAFSNGYLYLTYHSPKAQEVLLTLTGHDMAYVNGAPRGGDMYRYGWMHLPVSLKKGLNEIYVRVARYGRYGGITAKLTFPAKPVFLGTEDVTLPHIVASLPNDSLWVGMVVMNTTNKPLSALQIVSTLAGREVRTTLPSLPPLTSRKVGFKINASQVLSVGTHQATVRLLHNGKEIDQVPLELETIAEGKQYSRTFVSDIDGSVQYYSVAPQQKPDGKAPALFLSVHGAEVQAINQARAYKPKDWGVLVAPTNRRPRGFNWEDWGRLDALEVLDIAKKQFKPDPARIYLTGHSMGGHGTWYLGATYPDQWAAIAPCAGYPTLASYGSHDGQIPDSARSDMEAVLLRASNPSNVLALATNYKAHGIYINHGDADRVVPVTYARQMRQLLGTFHTDFSYYEYPGGSHWYSDESVDWGPLFEFFSWHRIPTAAVDSTLDFTTANPGISSKMRWVGIHQQTTPLKYSRVQLDRSAAQRTIRGTTQNVDLLSLDLAGFAAGETVQITLDSLTPISHKIKTANETIYLRKGTSWQLATAAEATQKGGHRYGTLKEPFNNRMVFVYGTSGTKEENEWAYNKARFDQETWYYRANGAVEVVADKEFTPAKYPNRGVIIYGNASTNSAWNSLLANCPIQVQKGQITAGSTRLSGDDLGTYFVWPRADSPTASVAVVAGTGLKGMNATNANQYFSGGSGFADVMIFSLDMLQGGIKGVKMAGFLGNDWTVEKGDFVVNE
ncbi:alpha/beta hydrolase [Rhabdobacter roseus]|uniref:Pimeloyl-ACP methyl ester carboxylesterase n=1 Tax=Rhabdobacter roseus TaxID=1655419 RepID=A0A840U6Q3_9BACT|nr:alpha/beta hydrolase-fold protein [Rhabdobacter roseus]MBB5287499.1 pimeloyl-ACP methyl ester carboxylesterase [Rhabdobacter roseus]